jgi:RNA polymerase sigma-70 factor (ECF subfamily)
LEGFGGQSRLGTWLHRIVVNASLMKLRAQQRKPERLIDDLLPTFLGDGHMAQPASQWAITTDIAAQRHEIQEVVRKSIDQLPESYRTVLLLRDIEERNTEEASKLLGISTSAVKTRLHRARQALRTLLDPYMTGTAS